MFEADMHFIDVDGRHYPRENGVLTVPSGRAGTWLLNLRNIDQPLTAGAVIAVQRYNIHFAYRFQTHWPERRDYVTVETTADARLTFDCRLDRDWRIAVSEGVVKAGDIVTLRLGDRRYGGVGSEIFWSTTRGRLTFDLITGTQSSKLGDDVLIRVTHRETPARMRLLGPSRIQPGRPFSLHAIVFDRDCNLMEDWEGRARFTFPAEVTGLPEEVVFTPADEGVKVIDGVCISSPSIVRLRATLTDAPVSGSSNPIVCASEEAPSVYWGELHAHGWGDQSMLLMHDRTEKLDPRGRHQQARRVGRYDYAAPGAMAMPDDEQQRQVIWQTYLDAWRDHDQPGRYVPFMAMEMHPRKGGDWTLIFRDEGELPPVYSTPIDALFSQYGNRDDALLEGHLGGSAPKFGDYLPAPGHVRLIEIASAFGGAEWILQDALAQGFRPALTGASDLHLGLMGAPRALETFRGRFGRQLNVRDAAFGSGPVGAIRTSKLDRSHLWTGLAARNTYATTGDRMVIDLDANGVSMGGAAEFPRRFPVALEVHGQTAVERIDLIVGDRLAAQVAPGVPDTQWGFTFDREALPRGDWFYFRIKQINNEFGWTAPIFFNDEESVGQEPGKWPLWNAVGPGAAEPSPELDAWSADAERYLETEGDREKFGDLRPWCLADESYGRCAVILSTWLENDWPVTIRWFGEYEIPKIRVDYGYESFGVTNCEAGPTGPPPLIEDS